jgi:MFS family permease
MALILHGLRASIRPGAIQSHALAPVVRQYALQLNGAGMNSRPGASGPPVPTGAGGQQPPSPSEPTGPLLASMWSTHSGLVVSATLVGLSAWNVMLFSGWDVETAQMVVQEQGTTSVLIGSLFAVSGALTSVVLGFAIVMPFFLKFIVRVHATLAGYWFAAGASAVVSMLAAPLRSLLIVLALSTVAFFLALIAVHVLARMNRAIEERGAQELRAAIREQLKADHDRNATQRRSEWQSLLIIGVTGAAGVYMFFVDPWLPKEQLSISGQGLVSGYVLSQSSDEIVFLSREDRTIERIRRSDLEYRTICTDDKPNVWNRPLVSLWRPEYPKCLDFSVVYDPSPG